MTAKGLREFYGENHKHAAWFEEIDAAAWNSFVQRLKSGRAFEGFEVAGADKPLELRIKPIGEVKDKPKVDQLWYLRKAIDNAAIRNHYHNAMADRPKLGTKEYEYSAKKLMRFNVRISEAPNNEFMIHPEVSWSPKKELRK